jgi:hypothetical protein
LAHDISIPEKYRTLYDRAMAGKSMKAAIRAHCLYCMGWDSSEIRVCTAPWCPLFPYRLPRSRGAEAQAAPAGTLKPGGGGSRIDDRPLAPL